MHLSKRNNKITIRNQLILIGSFSLVIGLCILTIKYSLIFKENNKERKSLEEFYESQITTNETIVDVIDNNQDIIITEKNIDKQNQYKTYNYIAVLKIPKIGLEKGLFNIENKFNNVNKNIEILEESDMPDTVNGNVILASHSGSGRYSYFKNLHKLSLEDEISIIFNNELYKYRVVNIYIIEKTGIAHIARNAKKDTLTLITCVTNQNKQLIVIAEKIIN